MENGTKSARLNEIDEVASVLQNNGALKGASEDPFIELPHMPSRPLYRQWMVMKNPNESKVGNVGPHVQLVANIGELPLADLPACKTPSGHRIEADEAESFRHLPRYSRCWQADGHPIVFVPKTHLPNVMVPENDNRWTTTHVFKSIHETACLVIALLPGRVNNVPCNNRYQLRSAIGLVGNHADNLF
jgi:hypothetical protein